MRCQFSSIFFNKNTPSLMATKILKNTKDTILLIATLFLMLVLIRLIKASFIILLNPILLHLLEQISSKIDWCLVNGAMAPTV